MKPQQSFWHRLAMPLLVLVLTMAGAGCNRSSSGMPMPNKESALAGKYILTGEREVASEIELYADGKFMYAMVYGAIDEGASGTWHSTDKQVFLEVDKSQQGQATPPPTNKLELRRDGEKLVLIRNGNELVYLKAQSSTITDNEGKAVKRTKPKELDIVGYNYTDQYIEAFNVDGYSGGSVALSSSTAGGGSARCCYPYFEGVSFPYEVEVEWGSSERWGPTQKAKVLVPQPKVANPRMLEIHFYPDGHLEAELTEWYSAPRMKLIKKNDYRR